MDATIAHDLASRGLDAEFWRGLGEGELRLPRCAQCGRWVWPAECRCGACGSFEWSWNAVQPLGTVFSWTRTWYPFVDERADSLPYVVVLVELAEAGSSRILGVLTGDDSAVAIGAPVRGEIAAGSAATGHLPSLVWRLVGSGASDAPGA